MWALNTTVAPAATPRAARPWRRRVTPRRVGVLTVVLFVVLTLLVAVLTPPWEANDEPSHVRNVETILRGHLYRMKGDQGAEAGQAPLYYLMLAGWQGITAPHPRTPAPVASGCNAFIHKCGQFRHSTATDGADQRLVLLLRLPGLALGIAVGLLTALAARRISRDPWTPVVAGATVILVPRLIFLSGVVNNDNLADALAAGATALAMCALTLRTEERRPRLLVAGGLGVVLGALILTKTTALTLLPGMLAAAYLCGSRPREGLELAALVAGVGVLVASPWLIYNVAEYGDPLALSATHSYLARIVPLEFLHVPASRVLFEMMPRNLSRGLWYQSGPRQFEWAWWSYVPVWLLVAFAVSGLARRSRPAGRAEQADDRRQRMIVPVLLLLVCVPVVTVWLLGLETLTASARWALVALPALGCLIALGFERLQVPVPLRFALPVLGVIGALVAIRQDIVDVYAPTRAAVPAHSQIADCRAVAARTRCQLI